MSDYRGQQGQYPSGQYQGTAVTERPGNGRGMGVAGLILGIVGLFLSWVPWLNIILGVLATVLGGLALRMAMRTNDSKGIALGGLILGILTIIISLILLITAASIFGSD